MSKSKAPRVDVATLQPDEINAVRTLVKEFTDKMTMIENEISTLKDDVKFLIEEYSEKLDMKTLQAALKVMKIQQGVQFKDTFDLFIEALTSKTD